MVKQYTGNILPPDPENPTQLIYRNGEQVVSKPKEQLIKTEPQSKEKMRQTLVSSGAHEELKKDSDENLEEKVYTENKEPKPVDGENKGKPVAFLSEGEDFVKKPTTLTERLEEQGQNLEETEPEEIGLEETFN